MVRATGVASHHLREGRLDVEQMSRAAEPATGRSEPEPAKPEPAEKESAEKEPPEAESPGSGPAEGVWRFAAAAHEASVPQTRHAVRDRLLAQGLAAERYQELVDDVLLIVSELVGNAVTHAAVLSPYLTAELAIEDGWVRISVEDGHPYRPKALESDHGQLGGRGLLLVKSVTLQAGGVCDVECTGEGGKVIWASLPLPAARTGEAGSEEDEDTGGEAEAPSRRAGAEAGAGAGAESEPLAVLDGLPSGGLWPA